MRRKLLCLLLALATLFSMVLPVATASAEENKNEYFVDTSVFDGCTVGVQEGTLYVDDYKLYFKNATPQYYKSIADAYTALQTGKIDVVLQDEPLMKYMASQNENISSAKLDSKLYYVAEFANKDAKGQKYISQINQFLSDNQALIEDLKKKWFDGTDEDRVMEDYDDYPATNGTLIIATDSVFAPFEYIKNGKIIGYEIEIMALFCKAYGYKPEFVTGDVGGILPGVASGIYDIGASCFFITEERKQSVLFSNPIYENYAGITYNNRKYKTTADFKGKKIGVQVGTTYVDLVNKFIEDADVSYYKSVTDAFTALESGMIEAVFTDDVSTAGILYEKENAVRFSVKTYQDDVAFVLAKNMADSQLKMELDAFITEMKIKGVLDELREKWIDGDFTKAEMEDYTSYPATNGTIVVATDGAYPPMELQRNGITVGYEFELLGMFCKQYGYALQVEICDFSGIIAGINSGNYTLGVSTFSVTEERKAEVTFTVPVYYSYPTVVFMDAEMATKKGFFESIISSFKKTFITENRWRDFADGIRVTMEITVLSILIGTIIGFLIHVLCRNGNKISNKVSSFCRWLIQGMPVVVFIMIMYYIILGKVGLSGIAVAIFSFSLVFACSVHNMLEGAEKSLDPGQAIGASALGYSNWKTFTRILLPQEIRFLIPSFLTEVSAHIKATAIVGYIAVVDLTKAGDLIRGRTYDAFFPLIAVAILYFVLAGILRVLIKISAKKTDIYKRSEEKILKGVERDD